MATATVSYWQTTSQSGRKLCQSPQKRPLMQLIFCARWSSTMDVRRKSFLIREENHRRGSWETQRQRSQRLVVAYIVKVCVLVLWYDIKQKCDLPYLYYFIVKSRWERLSTKAKGWFKQLKWTTTEETKRTERNLMNTCIWHRSCYKSNSLT